MTELAAKVLSNPKRLQNPATGEAEPILKYLIDGSCSDGHRKGLRALQGKDVARALRLIGCTHIEGGINENQDLLIWEAYSHLDGQSDNKIVAAVERDVRAEARAAIDAECDRLENLGIQKAKTLGFPIVYSSVIIECGGVIARYSAIDRSGEKCTFSARESNDPYQTRASLLHEEGFQMSREAMLKAVENQI